jgi:hypothetical protein
MTIASLSDPSIRDVVAFDSASGSIGNVRTPVYTVVV